MEKKRGNRIQLWYKQKTRIEKISYIGISISLVVAIITKSTASFSDLISGNTIIEMGAVSEIIFGISLGFITSSIVALYVEQSNNRLLSERNKYVKQTVLWDFSVKINRMLGEFQNGGDRRIDYLPYHYDHFVWSIENRILPFADECDLIIEKYTNLFSREEIEALDNAKKHARIINVYQGDAWKSRAETYASDMTTLYWHNFTGDPLPSHISEYEIKSINEITRVFSTALNQFQDALMSIKHVMPYIFK